MSLRLAEAIRIGSKDTEQCFGVSYDEAFMMRHSRIATTKPTRPVATCALGAASHALAQQTGYYGVLDSPFPELERQVIAPCHCETIVPGGLTYGSLGHAIVHLNDHHHWTRERIADWVAQQ